MFKFVTNNWIAKLICLILAVVLWGYVAVGESQVDNFPGEIALEIKNVPADLVAIIDTESVQIKISADRNIWNRLSSNSFSAYIDLKGLAEGTYEREVAVKPNVDNVEIVEIMPQKILVRLEKISKKIVPVKLQTEGEADEGLVPGDATIEPENVEISGAKSIVEKILEATAVIKLNGETENIEKTVALLALDAEGEAIKNISFTPKDVRIALPIVKAGTTKTVGIKAKTSGKPKAGFWISQIVVNPADIAIKSNGGVLKGTNFIETKSIDIEGASQNISRTIDLDLPLGVTAVDGINSVKVEIKVSPTNLDKEVSASISYENLNPSLKVDNIEPNNVKTVINGPADILTSINVQLKLNLANYKSAGSYSLDIEKSMFTIPAEVIISSFIPSSVKITLSNK